MLILLKKDNISIFVVNGVLNVTGIDNFTVYTIKGEKVNVNQTLQIGVYILKADNFFCLKNNY